VNFLPKRKGDVAQVYSSDKKLKRIFKWKPRYNDINKIIKSAINFEKKIKYLRA
jgi:UDP-glucose 4-epimerase